MEILFVKLTMFFSNRYEATHVTLVLWRTVCDVQVLAQATAVCNSGIAAQTFLMSQSSRIARIKYNCHCYVIHGL